MAGASCIVLVATVVLLLVVNSVTSRDDTDRCGGPNDKRFAPRFVSRKQERLESYTNSENDDIKRRCRATGKPEPTVTWYKDNKTLEENDRVTLKKASLSITSLIFSDEGTYKCVVSNECGSIEWTFTQQVVVNEIGGKVPPLLLQDEKNVTVYEGEDAKFQCLFYTNDPPTIWWLFHGYSNGTVDQETYQTLEIDFDSPETYVVQNARLNDSGLYECLLRNKYGLSGRRQWLTVLPAPKTPAPLIHTISVPGQNGPSKTFIMLIVIVVVLLAVLLVSVLVFFLCQRKRQHTNVNKQGESVLNPIYPFIPPAEMNIPFDPRWEFPRSNLELGEVIGVGFFGQVMKGYAIGLFGRMEPVIVAVKMLKSDATQSELKTLIQEMNTMKSIGSHINIINFLGCCTQDGPLFMLVEYAEHGNLRDFLRKQKPRARGERAASSVSDGYEVPQTVERAITPLTTRDLISFAYQIARGMEYLSSKKIIHRDLAARNILVADSYVLKIADFGLTKELRGSEYYTKQTETPLPIKWMALECLRDKKFTPKSDVWSYGILLWEIFAFGANPYPSVSVLSHERFYEWLEKGNRMDKPRHAPDEIYALMLKCWKPLAIDRPDFTALVIQLDKMVSQTTDKVYLNLDIDQNYITPIHEHSEGEECDIDDLEDDAIFQSGTGQVSLRMTGTKNSRRSDSQYSSLASSQEEQSLLDSCLAKEEENDLHDLHDLHDDCLQSPSHSSFSSLSHGSLDHGKLEMTACYADGQADLPKMMEGFPSHLSAWSHSADDVSKIQSPLLSSCNYCSDGHIDNVPETNDDDDDGDDDVVMSREADKQAPSRHHHPYQYRALTEPKPWTNSVDSMILVSDEDDDVEVGEEDEEQQPRVIVYSNDKVECVESFV